MKVILMELGTARPARGAETPLETEPKKKNEEPATNQLLQTCLSARNLSATRIGRHYSLRFPQKAIEGAHNKLKTNYR